MFSTGGDTEETAEVGLSEMPRLFACDWSVVTDPVLSLVEILLILDIKVRVDIVGGVSDGEWHHVEVQYYNR